MAEISALAAVYDRRLSIQVNAKFIIKSDPTARQIFLAPHGVGNPKMTDMHTVLLLTDSAR
jgi:hypothetical protein